MLAATVKIGSKNFVHMEVLQSIKSKMDHLPDKPKTMLDFRDAALFLYPCIKAALQKNYTNDEILQIIIKEGWELTQNSFRYLWSFFLSEDENYSKKKSGSKSVSKERRTIPKHNLKQNISNIQENRNIELIHDSDKPENSNPDNAHAANEATEMQSSTEENSTSENSEEISKQTHSAHFELTPDTEDL